MTLDTSVEEIVLEIFSYRSEKKLNDSNSNESLQKIFDGNPFKIGHAMLDLQDILGKKLTYPRLTEFETFQTIKDVIAYFEK